MKNNIYDSIYNELQKGLNIDDNDASIKYNKSGLNTEIDLMHEYVDELINGHDTKKMMELILQNYHRTQVRYQPRDIDEIIEIYGRCRIKQYSLAWLDISKNITAILDDNTELPLHDCAPVKKNIVFIKITTPELINGQYDNSILIHKDQKISMKQFCLVNKQARNFDYTDCVRIDDSEKDFDGWKHTYKNPNINYIRKNAGFKQYPAFQYASELSFNQGNCEYQGYVPACGQIKMVLRLWHVINSILTAIGGHMIDAGERFLTSSESNEKFIVLQDFKFGMKNVIRPVLPMFKKICK